MSLGVLSEYGKSLFASSPFMHRFFPRILPMRLNTFRVFGDDFVYPDLTYSLNTLNYFPRILRWCLNTFRAFSVDAERMKNTQREIFSHGRVLYHLCSKFWKNRIQGIYMDMNRTTSNFNFFDI
jgi:hypothetical protein